MHTFRSRLVKIKLVGHGSLLTMLIKHLFVVDLCRGIHAHTVTRQKSIS